MKYKVSVDKAMYCTGYVEVNAKDADKALGKVDNMISNCEISPEDVGWGEAIYDDASFKTTGDVDSDDDVLDEDDIRKNIVNALESLSGEEVADVYNKICDKKITYKEDSIWEFEKEGD